MTPRQEALDFNKATCFSVNIQNSARIEQRELADFTLRIFQELLLLAEIWAGNLWAREKFLQSIKPVDLKLGTLTASIAEIKGESLLCRGQHRLLRNSEKIIVF